MDIAIIGAGNVGTALAGALARAGHRVTISAKNQEHASRAAQATGAGSATSNKEAVAAGDVVILAVPGTAFDALVSEVGDDLAGKVVVDVSNRPTPDASGAGTSAAEELQARLPDASVVKAFNTAFATRQADPDVDGVSADGFVAGDDDDAKQKVLRIVESIGFRPVDAGSLAVARTLEGMGWLNISRNMQGGTWQDAWVLLGPDSRS
jgi:predicted dinucleotide-binding enzyme